MKVKMQGLAMIAVLGGLAAAPLAAAADPPAVAAPGIPAPFIGAPTNDNPNAGQFTVNFDDQGRYLGIGTAPEHYDNFALTPGRASKQARPASHAALKDSSSSKAVFTSFQRRLRDVVAPEAAMVTNSK